MNHYTTQETIPAGKSDFLFNARSENGMTEKENNYREWHKNKFEPKIFQLSFIQGLKEDYRIGDGVPMASGFPSGVYFKLHEDNKRTGRNRKLKDCYLPFYGMIVASERFKKFLESRNLKNVEYLPVRILDHSGMIPGNYFIIHPVYPQDCLDLEQSQPSYSIISRKTIRKVTRLVIDERRLDPEVMLFRILNYPSEVILKKELADQILAKGFTGVSFKVPQP
jgi:hypothetical protein